MSATTPGRSGRATPGRVTTRPAAVAALLVGLVLGLVVGVGAPAQAHAYLTRTNPADGSVVSVAPDRLALSFSEHVVLEATVIELVDGSGDVTTLDGLRLDTEVPDDTEEPSIVSAALPDLAPDAYHVRWSTLSSDDLHRTSGFFAFGVRTAVTASGFHEPRPDPGESGLRWALLLGLALALGSVLVVRLAPRGLPIVVIGRLGRWGAASAAVVAAGLAVDQVVRGGLEAGLLLHSSYAPRWFLREAGLLVLVAALGAPHRAGRARTAVLATGAGLAATGTALLGHAGSDPGTGGLRVVLTAGHLLAVLTWAGAVVCLAVLLVVHGGRRGWGDLDVRGLLKRFGRPALGLLGLGVATGVFLSGSSVGSVDAVLRTTYGRTLLLKVALVGTAALLAAVNHRRLRGRHDLDLPRRTVALEAGVAVLVIAATGVLTSAQPATEPEFRATAAATHGPVALDAADLKLAVDLVPGLPGVNAASIDVFDTRRPAPGQVTEVVLTVDGTRHRATPLGDGRWRVGALDLAAGSRRLDVTVVRPGLADTAVPLAWRIGAGRTASTWVSRAPVGPVLHGLGLLLLLGWLASVVVLVSSGRRARRPASPPREALSGVGDRPRPRTEALPSSTSHGPGPGPRDPRA